jgi:glyoxylase-like metal-dependent hydrolase (beta-lactamase superfamily II)
MLRWKQIADDFLAVNVGHAYDEKPFYWTAFYYYKGLLIDSGCPHTAVESTRFLEKMNLEIQAVLLTHFHEDHSGGAFLFQEKLEADVFAPMKSIGILAAPPEIPMYRQTVWGQPQPVRAKPLRERMEFGLTEILTYATPGHSFDHVSFLIDDKLFMGDLVANPTPVIIMKQEDYIALIRSLSKVLQLPFETAYGGHGIWPKRLVRNTLRTILKLKGKVEALHKKGLTSTQIVEELFSNVSRKVLSMEEVSEFEWSRKNLVESLLGQMHESSN